MKNMLLTQVMDNYMFDTYALLKAKRSSELFYHILSVLSLSGVHFKKSFSQQLFSHIQCNLA